MLSSPPAALAASTSACTTTSRSSFCSSVRAIAASSTKPVSPSVQSRITSPGARGRRPGVDVDLPVGAQRARDHGALRMQGGLLGRQRAGLDPLGDQRVVVGEARQHAAAPEIGARVADVGERHRARADERGRDGRAHARGARIGGRALGDAPVGEAHGRRPGAPRRCLPRRARPAPARRCARPARPRAPRPCRRRRRTAAARRSRRPRSCAGRGLRGWRWRSRRRARYSS